MHKIYPFKKWLSQEWRLTVRHPALWLHPTLFFGLVILIFGFALGTSKEQTAQLWPVILWIGALLAQLLAVDKLFKQEYREGSLDAWFLSSSPMAILAAALLPMGFFLLLSLLVASGSVALLLGVDLNRVVILLATLALGLPALFLWGALGAALTLRAEGSHLLIGLILLPFYAPVVIFATLALQAASEGSHLWLAHLALLGAFLVASSINSFSRLSVSHIL